MKIACLNEGTGKCLFSWSAKSDASERGRREPWSDSTSQIFKLSLIHQFTPFVFSSFFCLLLVYNHPYNFFDIKILFSSYFLNREHFSSSLYLMKNSPLLLSLLLFLGCIFDDLLENVGLVNAAKWESIGKIDMEQKIMAPKGLAIKSRIVPLALSLIVF